MNQNETQEKLDENFSSKPLVRKPRGRPRKNLLTNLKNISSQTKRKRGRPRKQIYKDELPEINMQKGSRTKVESDSDSDVDYSDHLKQTQAKNRKKKNAKKPTNINGFESEESENYLSTPEDEINDIETSHERNDENYEAKLEENFEDNLEENFEEKFEENQKENLEEKFEEHYFNEILKLNRRSQMNSEKKRK